MPKNYRFSTRITIVFTSIALMSVLIVSLASMSTARVTIMSRSQDFINTSIDNLHREITALLSSSEKSAFAIADEVTLTLDAMRFLNDARYQSQYLKNIEGAVQLAAQINSSRSAYVALYRDDNTLETIWFYDQNRDSIPELQSQTSLTNHVNLEALIAKAPPDTISFWSIYSNQPDTIIVLVPIVKNAKIVGYAGSEVSSSQIQRYLNNAHYLNTGQMWIANANGDSILTPTNASATSDNSFYKIPDRISEARNNNEFIAHSDQLWTSKILYNGWILVSNVAISDVLSGLDRTLLIIAITFIIVLLITLIVTSSFAKRIAAPYSYLAKRIKAIGEGDYRNEIGANYLMRKDEAGVLSNAIAAMQSQLQQNFDTITHANEHLELAVSNRTRELIEANERLEKLLLDMSETQKQLALSEKMASLSKVLVGLSHNMNTPLGNAITLVTYYEEKLNEITHALEQKSLGQATLKFHLAEGIDIVKHVYENIQKSRDYIDRIGDISRSRQVSLPEVVQLKNLIASQYIMASTNDDNDNTELQMIIDDKMTIVASPLYLSEIIYELLDNAIHHAQVIDEKLVIRVEAQVDEKEGLLSLSVIDNGIGLKPHEYYEIFTPLVTSQLSHRAGLGLSRVYQLVKDQFNGSIIASPNMPKGTSFHLKLFCKMNPVD